MSELARRTDFSVRSVASEVRALESVGLVHVESLGAADVVRLADNAMTAALRTLFQAAQMPTAEEDATQVKESLAAMGAPLGVRPIRHLDPDATLVRALRIARRDGTVLRVLPLVVARNEQTLDWAALKERARREKLKGELGVIVDLAGHLLERPSLRRRVADLKDRRRKKMRYFPEPRSSFERALAEGRTPPIARAWGFFMNVSEDSFRSTLSKHGA